MYRTELVEEITVKNNRENQCQNIGNGKGEISSCHNVFLGNRKSCIGFKKGLKGSLL